MRIARLDHLVLTVADIARTCAWYRRVLGMEVVTFGADRRALLFGQQKINLHAIDAPLQPCAANPTSGSADLCLLSDVPLAEAIRHFEGCGVTLILGPVERNGATGPILSVYLRDPDNNLIEVSEPFP